MLKFLFALCALVLMASPAAAYEWSYFLDQDRVVDPVQDPSIFLDYTVPADGKTYRWDFFLQSEDPDATISLKAPNEVFGVGKIVAGPDTFNATFVMPAYSFYEIKGPGLVSYIVSAQADFDHCDQPGPVGSMCAAYYAVWGNADAMKIDAKAPITVHLSVSAVPEPSTWALMIAGFGACGVMLRRQRRAMSA